jgi:hypothetical protein
VVTGGDRDDCACDRYQRWKLNAVFVLAAQPAVALRAHRRPSPCTGYG